MLILSPKFPLLVFRLEENRKHKSIPQMETPQALVRLKHAMVAPAQALALRLSSQPGCRASFVLQQVFGSPVHKSITKNNWLDVGC